MKPHSHAHGAGHSHSHNHSHGPHHHPVTDSFKWAFFLNLSFAIIELVGGVMVNSVAILSDAVHDFGDATAIGLAYFLEKKSRHQSDHNYSYGYRRWSTFSAVLTSMILVIGASWVIIEAVPRLLNPVYPNVDGMLALAVLGVVVNAVAFFKLSKAGSGLSQRALRLHFVEDAIGWIIVLIGAAVMKFYPLPMIDACLGVILSLWVIWNALKNLQASLRVFLQAAPDANDVQLIEKAILQLPDICGIHHLHYWSLDGETHILTAHIALKNNKPLSETVELKNKIKTLLKEQFSIYEATLELEWEKDHCADPTHDVNT